MLSDHQAPIFLMTAQSMTNVMGDDNKGTMELASVILQDPNLTVKLLKTSNSAYYNPSRMKMITVSRAILNLGSELILEMALLCSFFESIQSSANKEQATKEIALAIHAAVQAKALAVFTQDPSPEEIFIATLLNHIGSISFWCFCGESGTRIQALVKNERRSQEEAEREVVGFQLADLAGPLSKVWKLGGLIEDAIDDPASKNLRVALVGLGYEIAKASKEGAGSKKYAECLGRIEAITGMSGKAAADHIFRNSKLAADITHQFSIADTLEPAESDLAQDAGGHSLISRAERQQLQFQISQEISMIIIEKLDMNLLFETVLEGIKRGTGMDRVIFSLLSADKEVLDEKLSLGWRKSDGNQIVFRVVSTPPNLFCQALSGSHALWCKPSTNSGLYAPCDVEMIGRTECFVMAVFSNGKPTGIIYADRGIRHQPLTDDDFHSWFFRKVSSF